MNKFLISNILIFFLVTFIKAQQQQQCSADVYLNSYYVGSGPRNNIYHDIMVNNTGSSCISSVFVNVEFPPPSSNYPSSFLRAEQMNITTGELQGYGGMIKQYNMKQGGRIVWDSRDIRSPIVTLSFLNCSCPPPPSSTTTPTTTQAPVTTSTVGSTPPTTTTKTIEIVQHTSSNAWWFALAVEKAVQTSTKVEVRDSSSTSSFSPMIWNSWGYWSYTPTKGMVLPITVRLTDASGDQITLSSIISSFGPSSFDSHAQYPSSSSSSPSQQHQRDVDEVEATNTIHARIHEGSTQWWLGLEVSGYSEPIANISVKDNQYISEYQMMENTTWKYTVRQSIFTPITTPFYVHITSTSGKSVEFPVTSFTVGKDVDSGLQF